jgi:hypothetical protein
MSPPIQPDVVEPPVVEQMSQPEPVQTPSPVMEQPKPAGFMDKIKSFFTKK